MTHQYQPGELIEVRLSGGEWESDGRKYIGISSNGRIAYEYRNLVYLISAHNARPIPKVRKVWINLYPTRCASSYYESEADAINCSGDQLIKTICVEI